MNKTAEEDERLEDVFQDEVSNTFVKMTEFKRFARSCYGLRLSDPEIEHIVEDYRHSAEDQKHQILMKWKLKNGKAATVSHIRSLVKKYQNYLEPQTDRTYPVSSSNSEDGDEGDPEEDETDRFAEYANKIDIFSPYGSGFSAPPPATYDTYKAVDNLSTDGWTV